MAIDVSQLPDITGLLVRPDNPPREDVEGMDYSRCVALYNYLIQYAWLAEGRPLATLNGNSTNFFTVHGAEAEALRPRLDPSVVAFLDNAIIPPGEGFSETPLSIFASGLNRPQSLFAEVEADLEDQPVDSMLRLCYVALSTDNSNGGVIYHQRHHRVAIFMHTDDWGFGFPVKDHPDVWNPFETVLSHWIDLIHIGKVVAAPHEEPALFEFEKIGPWEWRPYSEAQVTTCVEAWDRLCQAIETRISQLPTPPSLISPDSGTDADNPEPLVASSVLDAASMLDPCFTRSLLSRARRPSFQYIAPGLLLPPADLSGFVASQTFTVMPLSQYTVPPVCLFPADTGDQRPIELTRFTSPWVLMEDFYSSSTDTHTPSRISAGLYTTAVDRKWDDMVEDGFQLFLPFTINAGYGRKVGARKSDGELVDRDRFSELFQHGFKPFGGNYYRPQRLERLLDCWRKLVEGGVWSVGPDGVEGTIDTFKDAETESRWRDYYIPPTW
ncbi:hypothetical protein N7460_014044 [Penicillium canescens]|uniref:Uncharacterized protein n=1 Tax=Penicillium canescens TaxID=5083 RepID=A0AAD6N395_PENCN|nr:hypothetical protein N7460_014044 [Penicillium canescens]KAJ6025074.1 hypothetical protein N7444_012753 [Penicillium canescens]